MPLSPHTLSRLRIFLLALAGFGSAGALLELVLLGHIEDWTQWIPVVVLSLGVILVAAALLQAWRGRVVHRTLRWINVLGWAYVMAGVVGLVLHLKGNREFELEMYPDLSGLPLVWEALTGATPALAPGTLIQLGLLALILSSRRLFQAEERTGL